MIGTLASRLVKPSASLMDRLRFTNKLLLMASVFLVPMALISVLLLNSISNNIVLAQRERDGAAVLATLSDLQVEVQNHRGKMAQVINRDADARNELSAIEARADAAMLAVDAWRSGQGSDLKLDAQWKVLAEDWAAIEEHDGTVELAGSFDEHSRLIEGIIEFFGQVSDNAGLSLDPTMSSYALIDFIADRGRSRFGASATYVIPWSAASSLGKRPRRWPWAR